MASSDSPNAGDNLMNVLSGDEMEEETTASMPNPPATEAGPSSSTKKSKAGKRKLSGVWAHFDRVTDEVTKKPKAQCKYCRTILALVQGSTSSLTRHAKKCAPKDGARDPKQSRLSASGSTLGVESSSYAPFDPDVNKSKLMKMIVCTNLPFGFGENPFFTEYAQSLNPAYVPTPRNTGRSVLIKDYDSFRNEIYRLFESHKGFISFASDMWTSRQHLGYLGIVAHFVDENWVLQKRLIGFKLLEHPHSGCNMAALFMDVLRSFNIQDKLFSITLDNASNNNNMVTYIHRRIRNNFPMNYHLRCSAHIINLVVQEMLKIGEEHILRIRAALLHISSSGPKVQSYKKLCKEQGMTPKKFDIDTKHRWNSTYTMLQSIQGYEEIIMSWLDSNCNDPNITIDESDFQVGRLFMNFLEVFYEATTTLSGSYYPTSCIFLHSIFKITAQFDRYRSYYQLITYISSMEAKFLCYWKVLPIIPLMALTMDPRYKLKGTIFCMKKFYSNLCISDDDIEIVKEQDLREALEHMYRVYDARFAHTRNLHTSSSAGASSSEADPLGLMWDAEEESGSCGSNDLDRYNVDRMLFTPEEKQNLDVLAWWKTNARSFPILSLMAKDLLTPPMSTVSVESAFSKSGRLISKERSRLAPDAVEATMCMDDWHHQEQRLAQLRQLDDVTEDFTYFSLTGDASD